MDDRRRAIIDEIPRMRRYARSLLRDRDAADDLVQDSLERALSRLDNWRPAKSRGAGCSRSCTICSSTRCASTKRRGQIVGDDAGDDRRVATPPPQDEKVASREMLDALQAISPDRRAALVMVAVEGFSYAEAANILGVPAGTLMSRHRPRPRGIARRCSTTPSRRKMIRVVER